MEDVMLLIEELEEELLGAKASLFGKKNKVDSNKCMQFLTDIKTALPDSIREARIIVETKHKQLEQADLESQQIVQEAHERAAEIMSESAILKRAEAEARAIRAEAVNYNDTMRSKARLYVDALFADMEKFLVDTLTVIRNNREELGGGGILREKQEGN